MTIIRHFLSLFLFISIIGCSGAVKLNYKPGQIPDTVKAGKPLTILLKPYVDSREGVDPRYVGNIKATVYGIHGDKIIMEKDIASSVNDAIKTHLTTAGFTVSEQGDADIIIGGEIKKLRLDIAGRDEIELELSSKIVSGKTGKVIWEGVINEKDDRFAGSFGNSKKTISLYISKTLAKVINKTIAELNTNIAKAGSSQSMEGIPIPEGMGRIFITTEPPRSKIYIGDIYYGLSPLTVDIEAGVYDITVKIDGFKEKKEKTAIRKGQKTELEINMERE
jgi:hypothetical protein